MAWNLLGILSPEARKPGASIHQHSSLGPLAPLAPGVCLLAAQPVPQVARKPGQAGSSGKRLSVDPKAALRTEAVGNSGGSRRCKDRASTGCATDEETNQAWHLGPQRAHHLVGKANRPTIYPSAARTSLGSEICANCTAACSSPRAGRVGRGVTSSRSACSWVEA